MSEQTSNTGTNKTKSPNKKQTVPQALSQLVPTPHAPKKKKTRHRRKPAVKAHEEGAVVISSPVYTPPASDIPGIGSEGFQIAVNKSDFNKIEEENPQVTKAQLSVTHFQSKLGKSLEILSLVIACTSLMSIFVICSSNLYYIICGIICLLSFGYWLNSRKEKRRLRKARLINADREI